MGGIWSAWRELVEHANLILECIAAWWIQNKDLLAVKEPLLTTLMPHYVIIYMYAQLYSEILSLY